MKFLKEISGVNAFIKYEKATDSIFYLLDLPSEKEIVEDPLKMTKKASARSLNSPRVKK